MDTPTPSEPLPNGSNGENQPPGSRPSDIAPQTEVFEIDGKQIVAKCWRCIDGTMRGSYPDPLPGRCGAKLVKTDPPRYCMRYPILGRKHCRRHGGSARMGRHSHKWLGGTSIAIRNQIEGIFKRAFTESLRDKKQTSAAVNIAVWDARLVELFTLLKKQGGTASGPELARAWANIRETARAVRASQRSGDVALLKQSLEALLVDIDGGPLNQLIEQRKEIDAVWTEIKEADRHSVAAKKVENKRRADRRATVTREEFTTVLAAIRMALWSEIRDRGVMERVNIRYQELVSGLLESET